MTTDPGMGVVRHADAGYDEAIDFAREIRKNCTCRPNQITFTDAIVQSLTTATLQNVEYCKPRGVWGELWMIPEKIFAAGPESWHLRFGGS